MNSSRLLYIFLLFWLLVDSLIGAIDHMGLISGIKQFALAYKAIAMLISIYIVLTLSFRTFVFFLLPLFLASILVTFIHLSTITPDLQIGKVSGLIKVIAPITFYLALLLLVKNKAIDFVKIKNIVFLNTVVLLINLYLYYFGLGVPNYGETVDGVMRGGRGFFYAGNEVAAVAVSIYCLVLYFFQKSRICCLAMIGAFLLAMFSLASKTAIIAYLVVTTSYCILRERKLLCFLSLVLSLAIIVFNIEVLQYISSVNHALARFYHFGQIYGFDTVLLGGEKRLNAISEQYIQWSNSPLAILFGSGWSGEAENNIFDLVFSFGILGAFIYLLWFFAPIFHIFQSRIYGQYNNSLILCTIGVAMLVIIGSFAGHVVQSSLVSVFWAMLMVTPIIKENNV